MTGMTETIPTPGVGEAVLEVVSPDGARRYARVAQSPFLIGRGAETGNHLQLSDRRISRECAAIIVKCEHARNRGGGSIGGPDRRIEVLIVVYTGASTCACHPEYDGLGSSRGRWVGSLGRGMSRRWCFLIRTATRREAEHHRRTP